MEVIFHFHIKGFEGNKAAEDRERGGEEGRKRGREGGKERGTNGEID